MAGCLLDELVDAFDEDEVCGGTFPENDDLLQSPLVDAEDYMRRAVQMAMDPSRMADENTSADPEEKLDFYRRMVQMQEMMRNNGYEGVGIVEAVLAGDITDGAKGIGLQVCSEFQKSGGCRDGMSCKFVHDGAFRVGANKSLTPTGPPGPPGNNANANSDEITVDPEDFIRRALQLRSLQQKNNKSAPGRSNLPGQDHHRIPYW